MGDSLQDQLRALGLAKEPADSGKQAKRSGHQPERQKRRRNAAAKPAGGGELPLDRAWALRERQEKQEANAARRRKQAEDRRRRQINAAIRTIVEAHRLNRADAELARHFMFRGRIRKLYVTPEQQAALTAGQLGIVYLTGGYHLLAPQQLEAVRAIDADHVVELDRDGPDEEQFPIPDDISW